MNILFYGGHYWDKGAWFRKQQFALRFSKRGHKVFYVEGSPSLVRKNKAHKNSYFKTRVKKINDNLFIITPSAIFPFPQNIQVRNLYNKKIFYDIRKILGQNNVNDFIIWINRMDFASPFINQIKYKKIVDICDDLPFYYKLLGDEKEYRKSLQRFELILSSADIPVVSALKIKEKYSYLTDKEIIIIPNGYDLTESNSHSLNIPEEIKSISKPVIGFIGTLFIFIDHLLIEYLISKRPNYNFVFVGGIDNGFPIENLKRYNNVYLNGKKPKEIIPNYINAFDICLNPFKIHEVNDSVNPVKIFEYLALNKPVISTQMYSLKNEEIAKYIKFARNYENFLELIDWHVNNRKFENIVPKQILQNYSWDGLFEKLLFNIKEKYNLEL